MSPRHSGSCRIRTSRPRRRSTAARWPAAPAPAASRARPRRAPRTPACARRGPLRSRATPSRYSPGSRPAAATEAAADGENGATIPAARPIHSSARDGGQREHVRGHGRDQVQPPEVPPADRRRHQRARRRHRRRGAQAGQERQALERLPEPRRDQDDRGHRRERELEAGVEQVVRVPAQQHREAGRVQVPRVGRPRQQPRGRREHARHASAHHGRRRADQADVPEHRDQRATACPVTRLPPNVHTSTSTAATSSATLPPLTASRWASPERGTRRACPGERVVGAERERAEHPPRVVPAGAVVRASAPRCARGRSCPTRRRAARPRAPRLTAARHGCPAARARSRSSKPRNGPRGRCSRPATRTGRRAAGAARPPGAAAARGRRRPAPPRPAPRSGSPATAPRSSRRRRRGARSALASGSPPASRSASPR